jgi:hypothetical protein
MVYGSRFHVQGSNLETMMNGKKVLGWGLGVWGKSRSRFKVTIAEAFAVRHYMIIVGMQKLTDGRAPQRLLFQ